MPRAKKATAPPEPPSNDQLTGVITRLRDQVQELATKNQDLADRNEQLNARKTKPARKFETEKIRVNGFVITVAGKDATDDEVWIERVGDSVVILTGQAAEDRRNGRQVDTPSLSASSGTALRSTRGGDESWSNLDAIGGSRLGLGPSVGLSDEQKAKAFAKNPLEQMADQIAETGTAPS